MKKMILLEEANHVIELVDLHMTVGLELLDETVGQENNKVTLKVSLNYTN